MGAKKDVRPAYRVEDLGKRALFLIPSVKVFNRKYSKRRRSTQKVIHRFLLKHFGGYTCASGNLFGFFQMEFGEYDELREFRVAFKEDDRHTKIPKLLGFLANIAEDLGEECVYLELGEDALLVYPLVIPGRKPAANGGKR